MNQGLNMTITTHLINFIDRNYRVNSLKVPFVFIIYVCLNSLFLLCNKLFFNSDSVDAFNTALNNTSKDDLLLITGSFYLAGDIRKTYCSEDKILKQRNSVIS